MRPPARPPAAAPGAGCMSGLHAQTALAAREVRLRVRTETDQALRGRPAQLLPPLLAKRGRPAGAEAPP